MKKITIFSDNELTAMLKDEVITDENKRLYMSLRCFDKTYMGRESENTNPAADEVAEKLEE